MSALALGAQASCSGRTASGFQQHSLSTSCRMSTGGQLHSCVQQMRQSEPLRLAPARSASGSSRHRLRQHFSAAASAAPDAATTTATVKVVFNQAGRSVDVPPGTNIYEAAQQAGVDTIVLGCCTGNCGICEVEVRKFGPGADGNGSPAVVRSCITGVPPGYERVEVEELLDDAWGLDGYDT